MFRSNRKSLIIAAVSSLSLFSASQAQTWVNPNTGNWSVPANWTPAAPASSTSTALVFNATGAQSYIANNDLGAFTLNALNFNNTGTGNISLTGAQLAFGGTSPGISQNGSGAASVGNDIEFTADTLVSGTGTGTLTLGGVLSSNPAASDVAGFGLLKSSSGTLDLTGTGLIRSLVANVGVTNLSGGNYQFTDGTLTATQGALVVGGVAGSATLNVLSGTTQVANAVLGGVAGSNNSILVSGNTARLNTELFIPATQGSIATVAGNTTLTVNNGGQMTSLTFDIGVSGAGTTSILVTGSDSRINTSLALLGYGSEFTSSSNSLMISGGTFESFANIDANTSGSIYIAPGQGVSSTVTVNSAGTIRSDGDMYVGGANFNNLFSGTGTTATLNIDGAGSSVSLVNGAAFITSYGLDYGSFGGDSTVSITNGATLNTTDVFAGFGAGSAVINVSGSNSQLNASGSAYFGMDIEGTQHTTVSAGADVTLGSDGGIALFGGSVGTLTITGAGSTFTQTVPPDTTNFFDLAGGSTLNDGTLSSGMLQILDGGTASFDQFEIAVFGQTNSTGTLTVDGAGSEFLASVSLIAMEGPNSRATVNVTNGGVADFGVVLAASENPFTGVGNGPTALVGTSTINVNSGGLAIATILDLALSVGTATMNVDGLDSQFLAPEGNDSAIWVADAAGGHATVNITNGGSVVVADLTDPNNPVLAGGVAVARAPGSVGTVNISGADSFLGAGFLGVAGASSIAFSGGTGLVNQSAGLVLTGETRIYNNGTYNLTGGTHSALLSTVDGRLNYNGGIADMGDLEVNGHVILSSGNNKTLQTTSLTINTGGLVDINDNGLIVNYANGSLSPASTIRGYITSGRNSGAWNGTTGITSAAAAANPSRFGIGYAQVGTGSTALNITSFRGIDVDTDTVVVRETYNGDADLSGSVDSTDFNRFIAGYGLTSGGEWTNGDFDYDGKVNTVDFNYLAGNFGAAPLGSPVAGPNLGLDQVNYAVDPNGSFGINRPADLGFAYRSGSEGFEFSKQRLSGDPLFAGNTGLLGSVVPEPATLSLLALAGIGLVARRRR